MPFLLFTHTGGTPVRYARREVFKPPVAFPGQAHNIAMAFGDYDRDGRTDAVAAHTDGSRLILYRNVTDRGSHRWLTVKVGRSPRTNERGGITARVVVKTGELLQFRDLNGGSSRASQNEHAVRFGLGNWSGAEWVAVVWPDGRQLVVRNVPANRILNLVAGE